MQGFQIRCIQFLTLFVLAAHALAEKKPDCACQCPGLGEDLCAFLKGQHAIVTSNEEKVKKDADIILKAERFLKDNQTQITRVVNYLVETHINSVLKDAVADGTPTTNPEGSAGTNVVLDWNLSLNRTHDYLTRLSKAMKEYSSELKEISNRTKNTGAEQADGGKRWSDEREQVLKRLGEVENSSSASVVEFSSRIRQLEEANSEQRNEMSDLKSEISPRIKEMEDKFILYKNITEFYKNLFELDRGLQNDSTTVNIGDKCTDAAYPEYCEQIVHARFCAHEFYRRLCCGSCTKAGLLPTD